MQLLMLFVTGVLLFVSVRPHSPEVSHLRHQPECVQPLVHHVMHEHCEQTLVQLFGECDTGTLTAQTMVSVLESTSICDDVTRLDRFREDARRTIGTSTWGQLKRGWLEFTEENVRVCRQLRETLLSIQDSLTKFYQVKPHTPTSLLCFAPEWIHMMKED
jgi:hypothetical protein